MKTYVLTVSEFFPKTHSKKGQQTTFLFQIAMFHKLHTIRKNYSLWKKRFEQINNGKACLSVRIWSGIPYQSKQKEMFNFTKTDGISLQKLTITDYGYFIDDKHVEELTVEILSSNDGLSKFDFLEWFNGWYNIKEDLAIIHFTTFRY